MLPLPLVHDTHVQQEILSFPCPPIYFSGLQCFFLRWCVCGLVQLAVHRLIKPNARRLMRYVRLRLSDLTVFLGLSVKSA
jgi:hypothetical protein